MDEYKAIRPYNDDEVSGVLASLLENKDFIDTFASFRMPQLKKWAPDIVRSLIRRGMRKKFEQLRSVDDIQAQMRRYLEAALKKTSHGVSISGLEKIDPTKGYLFISNHRDIVLDAALLSLLLLDRNFASLHIAIGDNLLKREFIGEVMRLNKCFIVKRDITKPRALLLSLLQLSGYIRNTVCDMQQSVWIAQREGRTKDGFDKTELAIIKMLMMSAGKEEAFIDAVHTLNIVPMTISYEYDPCDQLKAKEMCALDESGSYEKAENEDAESIFLGVKGFKGHIHIALGEPLNNSVEFQSITKLEEVEQILDRDIAKNYLMFPSNYFAYHKLYGHYPQGLCGVDQQVFSEEKFKSEKAFFDKRLAVVPQCYQKYLLEAYANPITNKIQYGFSA